MKLKVTTTIASLLQLAFLSAINSMEFNPLNGYSNKMRESSMENCPDYKVISKWLDLQDAAASSLKIHYNHIEEALESLTGTSTNCCFYDKDLMQSVMDNVKKIDQQNGDNESKTLIPSGKLRKDLNKIIPRIKKFVTKGFEDCCSEMEESLKKNKKDFWKQLKNVKEKLKSESSDELYQDRKELEEKHKKLREKIIDTKDRLDTLDNKKMRSGHQNHCCAELYTKTKDWENQINAARNETIEKSNQFESQLKDMEIMLYALKNRVKSAKNTLETQGEAVENELESCEQVFEKLTKTPNNNHICCENCLDKLLDRLKELEESVKSLLNKLDSVKSNNCQENNNRMAKIKDLTDQLDNLKSDNASVIKMKSALPNANPNARIHKLEQEVQNLQQAANDSQICCDKIPKINTFVEHLQSKIKQMQQSNPEILKQNKLELEDLKKQFNETLADMKNKQKELEKLKDLQAMLEKVKSELKVQEDELNELINKKNKNNVTDDGENTVQELDQFWVKVDTQLSDLEGQSLNETNQYSLLDDLQKSLDKAKLRLEDIRQHEKQDNVEEDKLKELENQLALCLDACKVVSRMHELFKNVNNIIQVIKYTSKLRVATTDKVSNILKIPSKPTPAAKKIIPKKPAPKTKKG